MYWFDTAYEAVARFMDMGGNVLWLIAILLFVMWALIFERAYYFFSGWKRDAGGAIANAFSAATGNRYYQQPLMKNPELLKVAEKEVIR